jgi:hypothetical protein
MIVSHSTNNSFVTSNQKLYIRNDDTFLERMSITSKIDKLNIHFDLAYVSTTSLSASKRVLSQRDAALVEERQ